MTGPMSGDSRDELPIIESPSAPSLNVPLLVEGYAREAFNRMTKLAAEAANAPIALVSILDAADQHYLGCASLGPPWNAMRGVPRSASFCRHVVDSGAVLIIEDARTHPLVKGHPAIEELNVLAYVGVPMATSNGTVVGTVCAIDNRPRTWTPQQIELLQEVAALALSRIELLGEVQRRRSAEQELKGQELRWRALIENLEDVIFLADVRGTIAYASASAARILGYPPDDIIGLRASELIHPDDRDEVASGMARLLRTRGAIQAGSLRLQNRDQDGWRVLEYSAKNLLRDPAVRAIVVNVRDVSRHRALEGQARQAQKLDTLGLVAGGVAHDFNNVLTAIHGFASIALTEMEPDNMSRSDIEEIISAADRGARLTKQLLSFSRTKPTETTDVDLTHIVRLLDGLLRRLLGTTAHLRVVSSNAVPSVRANPSEIEQVVMNLVLNARDAMPDGGEITVDVRGPTVVAEGAIPIDQQDLGEYVCLTVADTGVGIPDEHLPRIFDPLFTTKAADRGTGLGLSTVYSVVVRNRGRIKVSSRVGKGTSISVFLPVSREG